MLPFLKPKTQTGLIISQRKPDGETEEKGMEDQEDMGLMSAAEDLIRAVHAKDAKAVASALRAAFEIVDSEAHVEGEHIDDESA
jgi:hypothetical protein